jgi:hypothetical protein
VFLAKPAFKASFVAGYCLRPQGHKNDLFNKLAKMVFLRHEKARNAQKTTKNEQKSAFFNRRLQRLLQITGGG